MKTFNYVNGLLRIAFVCICACVSTNVWGGSGHTTHYGRLTATKQTGKGTVYISESTGATSGSNPLTYECGGNDSADDTDKTLYLYATADNGYYFKGWGTSDAELSVISGSNVHQHPYTLTDKITGTEEEPFPNKKVYAFFKPVTVDKANPTKLTALSPTALGVKCTATQVITFASTGGDNVNDFTYEFTSQTGDGTWEVVGWTMNADGTSIDVTVAYTANRDTYKNGAMGRTEGAVLGVKSVADGATAKTCNVSATFGLGISAGSSEAVTMTQGSTYVEGVATFPVERADDINDFKAPTIAPTSDGTWEVISYTYAKNTTTKTDPAGTVTVHYKFTPNKSASGACTATMTLNSNVDAASNTCTLTANVKSVITGVKSYTTLTPTPEQTTTTGQAVFLVEYAKDATPFTAAFSNEGGTAGGGWTVGTLSYANGELTVPYTFTHVGTEGTYTATLTLSTDGDSEPANLISIVEVKVGENEHVEVTVPGQNPVRTTWAEGLALANTKDGSTIRLLQDVDLILPEKVNATHTITKTMTLDLNGKILSATLLSTNTRLLYVNGAGKTLTIMDSRTGGTIRSTHGYNGNGYAVQVNAGNVILGSGTIEAISTTENTTNNDWMATGVRLEANTHFTMNGGAVKASHEKGRSASAVYAAGGGSTATIHAGEIEAIAKYYAYAVRGSGSATNPTTITLNNGTLKATGTSAVYGIASGGKINVSGGTIEVQTATVGTTAGAGSAYGILVDAYSNKVASSCYYGVLNMTGGTIYATSATSTGCGICFNATEGTLADPQPAQDGSHTNKAAATGRVENAIIYATTGTSYAYGVLIKGSYNSCTDASSTTVIDNITATVTAGTSYAYGIMADAEIYQSGATDYGHMRAASAEINHCNITAKTTKNSYAYGVYVDAVQKTIVNTAKGWQGEEYATAAKAVITGGKYTAIANEYYAYGVYSVTRVKTIKGNAEAYPTVEINGGEFRGETLTYHTACGIQSGGNTTINGGTFIAQPKTVYAYGCYAPSGKVTATDAIFTATGTNTAYGIYAKAAITDKTMYAYCGDLNLNRVTATATSTTGGRACGVYLEGTTKAQTQANYEALGTSDKNTYPYYGPDDPNNVYYVGEKVISPTLKIDGGTYRGKSHTSRGYGILTYNYDNPYVIVSATGKASGGAEVSVKNATIESITETSNYSYGICVNGPTEIDKCIITATAAQSTNAYGVYVYDGKTKLTNSTITTSSTTDSYGVYLYALVNNRSSYSGWTFVGELESEGNNITTKTTTGATARGLHLGASAVTTTVLPATGEYYAPLGEFACAASATSKNDIYTVHAASSSAFGISTATRVITNGGKAEAYPKLVMYNPTVNVTSGTSSAYGIQAGGITILDGGTFTAEATTSIAVGGYAPSGTFTATNTKFVATTKGMVASNSDATAYGIYGTATIPAYTMLDYSGVFTLNHVTAIATTTVGDIAYGVYMTGASKAQTQATYNALSDANKEKYPYYGEGDPNNIYYIGEKAIFPKVTIEGGTYTATANGNTARGIYMYNPYVSTTGKASAGGELTVKNATIEAIAQTNSTADGIRTAALTEIDNCKITAKAATTTVNGIYIYDNHTKLTNSTITAEGKNDDATKAANVYGVYLYAQVLWNKTLLSGWKYIAELESENNNVTATVTNGTTAYGLWLNAHAATSTFPDANPNPEDYYKPLGDYACAASATLKNDSYTALALGTTAYAVGFQAEQIKNDVSAAPTCTISGNRSKYYAEAPATFADIHPNGLKDSVVIEDGYFRNKANVDKHVVAGKAVIDLPSETPEYGEGYRYFLGQAQAPGIGVCKIVPTGTEYKTLEEALQVVTSGQTIVMLNSYTLQKGNYVLPTGASLLVPYKSGQTTIPTAPETSQETWITPSAYLTLTFAEGVNFTLQGNMALNAQMHASNEGAVQGSYGHLNLEKDARVDVEEGATLYVWGYVTGDGLINVKKGGSVHENFQIGDWPGGKIAATMLNNKNDVFPVTHYFYQNIESTIIYRAGAKAYGASAMAVDGDIISAKNVMLVGEKRTADDKDNALFLMDKAANGENVWIQKTYNPTDDRTYWTLNTNTTMSSIHLTFDNVPVLGNLDFNSSDYILPLSSNMTITLNGGTLDMEYDVYLMPGVSLNIAKEAKLSIPSGKTMYVVDKAQWLNQKSSGSERGWIFTPVFSPSWKNNKTSPRAALRKDNTDLPSAEIFVHGMIEVTGNLFTTAGGANIHSTNEDAGKVFFTQNWTNTPEKNWYQLANGTPKSGLGSIGGMFGGGFADIEWAENAVTSAQLRNGDGSVTQTNNDNSKGLSFNYINNQWVALTEGCLSTKTDSEGTHYYANPSDIVEVNDGNTEPGYEYTYSNISGEKRYFINTIGETLATSCVWWEVKQDANGEWYASDESFPSTYGGYYEYDASINYWKEQTVKVTWEDEDGTEIATYDHHKGLSPLYLEETPTKSGSAWIGWTSDGGVTVHDRNATLPKAKEAITYRAVYEENIVKHTVVFKDMNGGIIEAGLWAVGATPSCSVTPENILTTDKEHTFSGWSPAITEVQGPAEYRAQYTAAARPYTIHFVNYDGKELYTEDFAYGTMPAYHGATPTRESNWAYSYVYENEWVSSTGASGLTTVTGEEWYTAQFTAIEREYGDWLDVVDASASTLTLNMNGYSSASAGTAWTITVNNKDYTKTDRAADRTLTVALPAGAAADEKVLLITKGKDGVMESRRRYTVPHVYTTDATLGKVAEDYSSVIYVQGGTLTVDKDATVSAIYVAPNAELKINAGVTLAVDKLVLRTTAFASAVLTDAGTLKCKHVYYSRIVRDRTQFYPIALPFDVELNTITYSHGVKAVLNKNFGLMRWDAQKRADSGTTSGNWVNVASNKMDAQRAYQFLSTSAYYSEYYFPVTYQRDAADATIAVGAYTGGAAEGHWGWNAVCSPYTSRYTAVASSPEEAVKISVLNEDNQTYTQKVAETLAPATMFFYQASEDGNLSFGNLFSFEKIAPRSIVARRTQDAYDESVQTQWIQLEYGDATGESDETNIYLHPDKFTDKYDLGYDVQKLSTSGGLPFIWTTVQCGNLAFTALPDTVATQGIALSMYAPAVAEMQLTLVDNMWMSRLAHLYLFDKAENLQVDLLQDDYTWFAEAAACIGRFYLYPVMRKSAEDNVVTDVASLETAALVAYSIDKNIIVEHVPLGCDVWCYDIAGQLVASCKAEAGQVLFAVPTSGMYIVRTDSGVCKVMVNK